MADDTRDIAIQTRADVKHLADQVSAMSSKIDSLQADLIERKGMEKLVRGVYAFLGGAGGSGLIIAVSKFTGIPLPR